MEGGLRITEPGLYRDVPDADYHADPCPEPSLSSTLAKVLLSRSPLHAAVRHPRLAKRQQCEEKAAFDLGRVAHALLLGRGADFAVIDHEDWRTKAAREARDEAREQGLTPILRPQFEQAEAMVASLRDQLRQHECAGAFEGGLAEATLVWREENGVWCRARIDWMPDPPTDGIVIYDYKTTSASAEPAAFGGRNLFALGYDIQAAFYLRGIGAVLGIGDARLRFVVQETEEPFAATVLEIGPGSLAMAGRQVTKAIEVWGRCLETGIWPAYPPRVCHVEAPAWHEHRVLDAEARETEFGDVLDQYIAAFAPGGEAA